MRNLHAALLDLYPAELGGGSGGPRSFQLRAASDNWVISPDHGPGRQRLLSGDVGFDQLLLVFTMLAGSSDVDHGQATAALEMHLALRFNINIWPNRVQDCEVDIEAKRRTVDKLVHKEADTEAELTITRQELKAARSALRESLSLLEIAHELVSQTAQKSRC
jgi:hypothetical protein